MFCSISMGGSAPSEAAAGLGRGRGREHVLRGERAASDGGGLINEVGNELASEVLRCLWDGIPLAFCSANGRTCIDIYNQFTCTCTNVQQLEFRHVHVHFLVLWLKTYPLCILQTLVSTSDTFSCTSPFWNEGEGWIKKVSMLRDKHTQAPSSHKVKITSLQVAQWHKLTHSVFAEFSSSLSSLEVSLAPFRSATCTVSCCLTNSPSFTVS